MKYFQHRFESICNAICAKENWHIMRDAEPNLVSGIDEIWYFALNTDVIADGTWFVHRFSSDKTDGMMYADLCMSYLTYSCLSSVDELELVLTVEGYMKTDEEAMRYSCDAD